MLSHTVPKVGTSDPIPARLPYKTTRYHLQRKYGSDGASLDKLGLLLISPY
jgi:hypothetical protein